MYEIIKIKESYVKNIKWNMEYPLLAITLLYVTKSLVVNRRRVIIIADHHVS